MEPILQGTRIGEVINVVAPSSIVYVQSTASVRSVLQILVSKGVYSVPVFDTKLNKFVAFCDLLDIICFLLKVMKEATNMSFAESHIFEQAKCCEANVMDISDLSEFDPFFPLKHDQPLIKALELLGNGVRRIPIMNEKEELIGVLTQSNVIQWLNAHLKEFNQAFKRTVESLGVKPVVTVKSTTPAFQAFELMVQGNITSVPILDYGKIIGVVSAKDIKVIQCQKFLEHLRQSVLDVVSLNRQNNLFTFVARIICTPQDSIMRVVQRLAASKVHRAFVVDSLDSLHVVGVVSLTDIIRMLLQLERGS